MLGDIRMTQKDLSIKTGIREATINAYYHNYIKRINLKDMDSICGVLKCTPGELFEYIPDKK
jgi:putative transcriptional regulator